MGIFYIPQLLDRFKGDIKYFFDKEVNHRMPYEDLVVVCKALEKVPIVELKYSVVRTNSTEEVMINEPLLEGAEAMVSVNLTRTNRSNR